MLMSRKRREPLHYSIIRMDGYKFNILLGLISFFVVPFIAKGIDLREGNIFVGIIGLIFYFGEAWAFNYKTRLARARVVRRLIDEKRWNPLTGLPKLGCMVSYGFIMRLCFRIAILAFSMMAFGGLQEETDPHWIVITVLMIGVLFEMAILGYAWMDARLDPGEEGEKEKIDEESSWRKSALPMLDDENMFIKETFSDLFLFITALMYTHGFWTLSNGEMIASIDHSHVYGESGWSVFLLILLSNAALCLFMLVPVRLAYWVDESISTIEPAQKRKLRWSLVFAGLSMTAPPLVHFMKVYCL